MRKSHTIRYRGRAYSHQQTWRLIRDVVFIEEASLHLHAALDSLGGTTWKAEIVRPTEDGGLERALSGWHPTPFKAVGNAVVPQMAQMIGDVLTGMRGEK